VTAATTRHALAAPRRTLMALSLLVCLYLLRTRDVAATSGAERRLRVVEQRHGSAGALASVGGVWGAISGPPTIIERSVT